MIIDGHAHASGDFLNADDVYFVDNAFYNIKFNLELNDSLFNTSEKVVEGFRVDEIEP